MAYKNGSFLRSASESDLEVSHISDEIKPTEEDSGDELNEKLSESLEFIVKGRSSVTDLNDEAESKDEPPSKLLCSKCTQYLSFFPIHLSRNLENVCGRCQDASEKDWSYVRNEIYEEVARDLSFPCRYKTKGCLETRVPADIPDHENTCQYRTISCATEDFTKCPWRGPFADLAEHCQADHSSLIDDEVPSMDFENSFERHHILKFNDDLFLINLGYNVLTNVLSATCTSLSIEPEVVSKYRCKLVLANGSVSTHMSVELSAVLKKQPSLITLDQVKSKTGDVVGTVEIVESIAAKRINEDLLAELQCPVCLRYMTGSIYQCTVGHSFCGLCQPSVARCPTCRSKFSFNQTRNFALENIRNVLVFPCVNSKTAGCSYVAGPVLVRKHEEFCSFGVHSCPLECGWEDSWRSLPLHVEDSHSDLLLKTNSKRSVLIDSGYFDKVRVNHDFLQTSRNVLFLVTFFCDKRYFFWEISLFGPPEEAVNYNFEVKMRSDRLDDALLGLIRTSCCSFRWNTEKPQRQFASLPVSSVTPFIFNSFTYSINLVK